MVMYVPVHIDPALMCQLDDSGEVYSPEAHKSINSSAVVLTSIWQACGSDMSNVDVNLQQTCSIISIKGDAHSGTHRLTQKTICNQL